MLFASLTLCSLITYAHPQIRSTSNPYQNQFYNQGNIFFNDNPPGVLPLSIPTINQDVLQNIFQVQPVQPVQPKGETTVEVERSNELSYTSTVSIEQPSDRNSVAETSPKPAPTAPTGNNNLLYSVTNFGVNLLKSTSATQPGNVVVSPYSITTLLALLQQGALGQTQQQLTNALQMSPAASLAAYTENTKDFKNRLSSRNILKSANNIFVADAFSLNPNFRRVAQNNFDSDITPVSFARPELIARQINSWVASRTNNQIEKLVSPDSLDSTTQVVLVNAIYFKGLWEIPFRVEATKQRDFHLSNGQTKTAPFMRIRKLFRTGVDPTTKAKVVILPFERDQYSLMVILPYRLNGLSETLESLTDARLVSYQSFQAIETELELPKFTVSSNIDLEDGLSKLGVTNIFSPYAELNGLGLYRTFSPQISSAVHSAVLSIDEQGGSAAAATSFAAVALSYDSPAVVFKADRPFIAVLWDSKSSLPLFMAKIEDPKE